MLKVIIDFDGTLTAEEEQVGQLASLSLDTLSREIIGAPRVQLDRDYEVTRARLLASPRQYWWEVNGLVASYCNEGAFILNTTTLQVMLRQNDGYSRAAAEFFDQAEYDPVVDCTNYLFHRHTAEIPPQFRPTARDVLAALQRQPARVPVVLTNSLGDKVQRQLGTLELDPDVRVLGDTRQYEMMPDWKQSFRHPELGPLQIWPFVGGYPVDLRRPAYYRALEQEAADGSSLVVVADTFSLPGALPLVMGIPFILLRTAYTPSWCVHATRSNQLGFVLDDLGDLPGVLDTLSEETG